MGYYRENQESYRPTISSCPKGSAPGCSGSYDVKVVSAASSGIYDDCEFGVYSIRSSDNFKVKSDGQYYVSVYSDAVDPNSIGFMIYEDDVFDDDFVWQRQYNALSGPTPTLRTKSEYYIATPITNNQANFTVCLKKK